LDLSPVQKYRFIRLLVILVSVVSFSAHGQEVDLYQLYIDGQIATLESMLASDQIKQLEWKTFISAIFQENFDEALRQFINIYHHTRDQRLKKLVVDRVSQYYYAKGLYDSAERILEDEGFRNQIFSVEEEKIYFGVQLGAFSSYENAANASTKFQKNISDITVIKKNSAGKVLYVILTGKFENKDSAENYKNQLNKKYGYKGIIIQY
jgi:SPOR domain